MRNKFMRILLSSCLLFLIALNAASQNLISQDSSQKDDILHARERERTKEQRLKRAREEGSYSSDLELYPTPLMTFAKGFSNGLGKITVNGRAGFIDAKGRVVIKPNLKEVGYFSEGLAPYEDRGGKWGFIDTKGKIAIAPRFDWAISFKEGLALVQVAELWGYIDRSGKLIILPQFKEAASFSEGLARVGVWDRDYVWENTNIPNGKINSGFIDRQGKFAIEPTYDSPNKDFDHGMALVSRFKTSGEREVFYIDKAGKELWVLDSFYVSWFSDDLLVVVVGEDKNGKDRFSFLDRTGKRVTDNSFAHLWQFSEGLAVAKKDTLNDKTGFIDKKGDFVIVPKFESAGSFSEGLAAASIEVDDYSSNKYGFIEKPGNWVIKPRFQWVGDFREGFALVAADGRKVSPEKFGYIDRKGNYIWKPSK